MNSQSSHSALPQELYDHIVDHLKLEQAALAAASLVSRLWTSRCQQHLLRVLTVRTREQWGRLADMLTERIHLRPLARKLQVGCSLYKQDGISNITTLFPNVRTVNCIGRSINLDIIPLFAKLDQLIVIKKNRQVKFHIAYTGATNEVALRRIAFPVDLAPLLGWLEYTSTSSVGSLRIASLDFAVGRADELIQAFLMEHRNLKTLELHLRFMDDVAPVNGGMPRSIVFTLATKP
jgi:hypothetical protein